MPAYRANPRSVSGFTGLYHQAPPIIAFGYNIDEEQFEVEIAVNRESELVSAFWDRFVPL